MKCRRVLKTAITSAVLAAPMAFVAPAYAASGTNDVLELSTSGQAEAEFKPGESAIFQNGEAANVKIADDGMGIQGR